MSHTANFLESIAQNFGITGKFSNSTNYSVEMQPKQLQQPQQPQQPPNTPVCQPVVEPDIPINKMNLEEKEDPIAIHLLEKYRILYKMYEDSLDKKKEMNQKLDELEQTGKSRTSEYSLKLKELESENRTTSYISDQLEDVFVQIKACGYSLKLDFSKGTHILIKNSV